ncbi:hypothetical protein ACHAXR_010307 [Thalassiosira sp. AJA248-18]
MNLKYSIAILLGLPVVIYGNNLRGPLEEDDEIDHAEQGRRALKLNAAQKRQNKRDRRRYWTNPGRTMAEEDAERDRKHMQGSRPWRNPRADPYEPGYGDTLYARNREVERQNRCATTGRGCGYKALEWDPIHGHYRWDRRHGIDYPW